MAIKKFIIRVYGLIADFFLSNLNSKMKWRS
ncbi:hypothetical protein ES705_11269 [subsurface metagenome]